MLGALRKFIDVCRRLWAEVQGDYEGEEVYVKACAVGSRVVVRMKMLRLGGTGR